LTPFVLHQLGIERYGIWVLITSLIGSYGMLDFGFRAGVNQSLIRSISASDFARASRVLSSALFALSSVGIVGLIVTAGAALFVPPALDIPIGARTEALYCILVVGFAASLQIAASPFASVFVAIQRFDIFNLIGISMRLLSALGVVISLELGYGLVGVAAATAGTTALGCILRYIVATKMAPQLRISRRHFSVQELRVIATFGLWNFLITISEYGYLHLLPVLIALYMPVSAVGHYALAAGLWQHLQNLLQPIGRVIYPAAAELHVQGDSKRLYRLYRDGTRLMLLVAISLVTVAFIWADDFYRMWIGEQYLSGDPFVSVSTLLRVLLIATVLAASANFASQILLAAGHIRQLAILKFCSISTTLLLSAMIMGKLGLIALPVSVVLAVAIFDFVAVPAILWKVAGLNIGFFSRVGRFPILLTAPLLALILLVWRLVWAPQTWLDLILQGAVAAFIIVAVVYYIGITAVERRQILLDPARKVLSRIWFTNGFK
jgi:O-antigen/teichoic acid export membrane protein